MKLDVIRDILDKQLVDVNGTKMGRVDGVTIELREGEPPIVHALQLGALVLAKRIHPRLARVVEAVRRRVRVRETAVQDILWPQVAEITPHHVKIASDLSGTPAFAWEKWLRDHIVNRIPGAER